MKPKLHPCIENHLKNGIKITELDVVDLVINNRISIAGDQYKGESFSAISSAGPNGAIVHYKPTIETNREIFTGETFLLDAGAQYVGATTDITRTLFVGTPSRVS